MPDMIRLCPDGTVPLVACPVCCALTLVRDAERHAEWHAGQRPAAQGRRPFTRVGPPPDPGRC